MKLGNTNCKKYRYLSLFNMLSMKKYGPIIVVFKTLHVPNVNIKTYLIMRMSSKWIFVAHVAMFVMRIEYSIICKCTFISP